MTVDNITVDKIPDEIEECFNQAGITLEQLDEASLLLEEKYGITLALTTHFDSKEEEHIVLARPIP